MDTVERQNEVLEMRAKNEEKISELYETYASKFTDYQEFWSGLAREELGHAAWIRKLQNNKDASLDEKRLNNDLVQVSLKYLGDKILEAKTQNITLSDALSIAIELETNMIERNFFTIFEGDSLELKETFESLAAATQSHVEKVRNLWVEKR